MRQPVQARVPGLAGGHALRLIRRLWFHMEGGKACWCTVCCNYSVFSDMVNTLVVEFVHRTCMSRLRM